MDPTVRLGVDLGGTKIEVVVLRAPFDAERADVLAKVRVPTERDAGYEHVVARAAAAIAHGVGGGVVFGDRAWDGAQGIAGEWGHVVLEPASGPSCYCGKRGCVEQFLSGPAIERAYAARSGRTMSLPAIAASQDEHARATL